MKTYRATGGPFAERPYYTDVEIEQICEDALRATRLYPERPEAVRIERFIEKRFNVIPRYEDLPDGVLGYSCFGPNGMESMHVSRALAETGTRAADRLVNSTLAHEAGHGLFHAHLFALANAGMSLFGSDPDVTPTRVLCRDRAWNKTYDGRWWELQAGKAIGPLLMPRDLVIAAVRPLLEERGALGGVAIPDEKREDAARILAEVFSVNPAAARVRLAVVLPDPGAQLTL